MDEHGTNQTSFGTIIKANVRNYSMVIMFALIMGIFAILTNGTNLNSRNITNILIQYGYIFILAVGMVQVIIIGNIDLSVGRVCAFVGAISAMLYNAGIGLVWTIVASILIGLAVGAFQGAWIAFLKIPAFIVTLAGMLLFRGITYIITNVTPIALKDDSFKQIASGFLNIDGFSSVIMVNTRNSRGVMVQEPLEIFYTALLAGVILIALYVLSEMRARRKKTENGFDVLPLRFFVAKLSFIALFGLTLCWKFATYRGIPIIAILLGLVIVGFSFMMKNTILGRYIYAVGGNARSAKLSGINSERIVFIVHVMMGGLCGLAGIVFTGYMNSALPQSGENFELDAIAACFIGGASTSGGIGTVVGAITGGLVMAAINNGMSLKNLGPDWQYVVKASVLLLAVFYDIYTRRKSGLG